MSTAARLLSWFAEPLAAGIAKLIESGGDLGEGVDAALEAAADKRAKEKFPGFQPG